MSALTILLVGLGVILALLLGVLLVRGRFGTPAEQGTYELNELASSAEVPRRTLRKDPAVCRGRSDRPLLGAGILWLTDDELGFLLRTPRRRTELSLDSVDSVTVTDRYVRPGLTETSDRTDFLVVTFSASESGGSLESVCFQLDEPDAWAHAIDRARSARSA